VPAAIARAPLTALTPPRGPVFVSIPEGDWSHQAEPVPPHSVVPVLGADPDAIGRFARVLAAARRPAIVVGQAADASGALPRRSRGHLPLDHGVAEVYRANIDGTPIEAVQQAEGVGYRTAARYVQLCRDDEFQLLPRRTAESGRREDMRRQQLPPQIKKISVKDRSTGKTVVRYQLTVDAGHDPESGNRRQVRRRFATEAAARAELASVQGGVTAGTYVHASKLTVDAVCEAWLASKHSLKESTLAGHLSKLSALRDELGDLEVQKLSKAHLDELVGRLRRGEVEGRKKMDPTQLQLFALPDDRSPRRSSQAGQRRG